MTLTKSAAARSDHRSGLMCSARRELLVVDALDLPAGPWWP
jgi:hypothetical protein